METLNLATCRRCGYPPGEHSTDCPVGDGEGHSIERARRDLRLAADASTTGRLLEREAFGAVDMKDARSRELLKRLKADNRDYLPFDKAVEFAKQVQPGDPTNPGADFLRELRLAIIEQLGEGQDSSIGAYTAVGTPLDRFHGIDAFVLEETGTGDTMVTLDATLRKDKAQDGARADVIVTQLPSVDEDEDAYLAAIDAYAKRVVGILRTARSGTRKA